MDACMCHESHEREEAASPLSLPTQHASRGCQDNEILAIGASNKPFRKSLEMGPLWMPWYPKKIWKI